jgi:hypothetical protein
MSTDEGDSSSSSVDVNRQQQAMLAQLFRAVLAMQQIDELFQWLADNSVQRFKIPLIQFWTNQINAAGLMALQLRTLAYQDAVLPEHLTVNNDVALVAQRMVGERRIYKSQLVDNLFSPYRAMLLKRYGLNYCTGSFIDANVLLSPPENMPSNMASPFAMTILLFTYGQPHMHLMSSISNIVNQAVIVAGNRGMLQASTTGKRLTSGALSRQNTLSLTELIPRRKQDTDTLLLSNPLSGTTIIADKRARRLYTAINGRANVAALCKSVSMDIKEVYIALHILLKDNRIEIYEPGGQPFDISLLPDSL